ncbi:hypothetical protein [Leminorella grimontii]|uniref:hypothetical protein n=1 Tax=Leminorella grimontii TaxID=82981 RepID=UPI00321F86FC
MLRKIIIKMLMIFAFVSPIAHAQWITNVDDDLFSGGKKAMMYGELNSLYSAIIFDCTKEKLSVAYIEEDKSSDAVPSISMDLIIKIDGFDAKKLHAILSRRNAQKLQIASDESETIKELLKQLKSAKSKILVGIQTNDGENQTSFSGNVSGSTAAVTRFVSACEIKI